MSKPVLQKPLSHSSTASRLSFVCHKTVKDIRQSRPLMCAIRQSKPLMCAIRQSWLGNLGIEAADEEAGVAEAIQPFQHRVSDAHCVPLQTAVLAFRHVTLPYRKGGCQSNSRSFLSVFKMVKL